MSTLIGLFTLCAGVALLAVGAVAPGLCVLLAGYWIGSTMANDRVARDVYQRSGVPLWPAILAAAGSMIVVTTWQWWGLLLLIPIFIVDMHPR